MTTLRERFAKVLLKPELLAIREQVDAFSEFIARRPYVLETNELGELDSRTIDSMVRHLNDIRLDGGDVGGEPPESNRLASVAQCRHQYYYDPVTARIINLWTDYGFGANLEVSCTDDAAQEVWGEYWEASRNKRVLGTQRRTTISNRMLTDGEFYWLYFVSELDGSVTTRIMLTDQVTEIITPPGDAALPLYYERRWTPPGQTTSQTWWYRDAEATVEDLDEIAVPSNVVLAADQGENTDVYVAQVAWPSLGMRGWPLMASGADWARAYKTFMEDRTAVAAAAAMFYRKMKVKGGSRMADTIAARFNSSLTTLGVYDETNPPPVAGSTYVGNEAVDVSESPMHTGAGDADRDGAALIAMAGIAAGVFPHYLGRGEAFRLATATALEEPLRRQFQRLRTFWNSVWRDQVRFVLDMQVEHGRHAEWSTEQYDAVVSTDSLVETELTSYSQSLSRLYNDKLINQKTAATLALQALNVANVDDLLKKMFPEEGDGEEPVTKQAVPDFTPKDDGDDDDEGDEGSDDMPSEAMKLLTDLFREARRTAPDEAARLAAEVGLETIEDMRS